MPFPRRAAQDLLISAGRFFAAASYDRITA